VAPEGTWRGDSARRRDDHKTVHASCDNREHQIPSPHHAGVAQTVSATHVCRGNDEEREKQRDAVLAAAGTVFTNEPAEVPVDQCDAAEQDYTEPCRHVPLRV